MLSVGAVRSKNVKNMLLYILLDATVGAVGWYLLGYGFAYGDRTRPDGSYNGNGFIGNKYFSMKRLPYAEGDVRQYGIGGFGHWFFQYTFAATASTIVSGCVVERAKLSAYIVYSFFLTAFVYPVVAHWEWSYTGWLSASRKSGSVLFGSGIVDFAGCGAVHMVGGFTGLVGAYLVGPRIGRYAADGSVVPIPGHNVPYAALGTLILWFGWYGFNCGSAGGIIGMSDIVGRVAVSTTLGGAAGGIACLAYAVLVEGCWDVIACLNGTLCGLVSITSGCAFFEPWAAIVAGGVGGFIFPVISKFLTTKMRIDDPLEAGAMHAGCGMWGLLATGLLAQTHAINEYYGILPAYAGQSNHARPGGGFYGHGQLLAAQIVGIVTIAGWVVSTMFCCFWLLKRFNLLRVEAEAEEQGMDVSYHGGTAYPGHMDGSTQSGGNFFNDSGILKPATEIAELATV
jgi:Amt family ammonium transporter